MDDDFMLTAPKKRAKRVRESKVEKTGRVQRVEAVGGLSLKWVSPGYAGVTDQIELYGVQGMIEYLSDRGFTLPFDVLVGALGAAVQFTEYKAPKKPCKPHQLRFHNEVLRPMGFTVNVIDKL